MENFRGSNFLHNFLLNLNNLRKRTTILMRSLFYHTVTIFLSNHLKTSWSKFLLSHSISNIKATYQLKTNKLNLNCSFVAWQKGRKDYKPHPEYSQEVCFASFCKDLVEIYYAEHVPLNVGPNIQVMATQGCMFTSISHHHGFHTIASTRARWLGELS